MQARTSEIIYDYWNKLRGNRLAPKRFEVDPASIADILPETFILERIDANTYTYRLAGTKLCEQFDCEFRGQNFLNGWCDNDHRALIRKLSSITSTGAVLVLDVEVKTISGRSVHMEYTLLPLVHSGKKIDRILGSATISGGNAWFDTETFCERTLIATDFIWPTTEENAANTRLQDEPPIMQNLRNGRIVRQERRQFRVFEGGLSADGKPDS